MTVQILERDFPTDHLPLLRWLMFTGVCAFGAVLASYYGLFHLMLSSDKTYISAIIIVLYIAASLHCCMRTVVISRELDAANRVAALVSRDVSGFTVAGQNVTTTDGTRLPPGQVTGHIRNLILKTKLQGHHRLDQTLLLRGLADALRGPNQLGAFAATALPNRLVTPIAGLDAADHASVKSSMGLMSDGMAVAMYTTLSGLIGSILLQTQYYLLDNATANLFALATDLTEVFVVSVLEREQDGQQLR